MENKNNYHGISYPFSHIVSIPIFDWLYKLWKQTLCQCGIHLLDEVLSFGSSPPDHYLGCDACGLRINIASTEYDTIHNGKITKS